MSAPTLRPRPGGSRLASGVDALTARVRDEELAWFEGHVGPELSAEGIVRAMKLAASGRTDAAARAARLRAAVTSSPPDRIREVLERHLRETSASGPGLALDLLALDRDLDLEALLEREAATIETEGARVEVGVRLLAGMAHTAAAPSALEHGAETLISIASDDPRPACRRAAAEAMAALARAAREAGAAPPPRVIRALLGLVRGAEDPWVRRAALDGARTVDPATAATWLRHAEAEEGRDAILWRARAADLWCELELPGATRAWERLGGDPSELVRFAIVDGLARRADDAALARLLFLALRGRDARTRARAVCAFAQAAPRRLDAIAPSLSDEPLVASFAIDACIGSAREGARLPQAAREGLRRLVGSGPPAIARRASLALHVDRLIGSPALPLAEELAMASAGEARVVRLPDGVDALALAEALVPHAAVGYGFHLSPRADGAVVVTRGDVLGTRLWRVLHELRSPAPTKRQSTSHLVGRTNAGAIRVPPAHLAEESATGVPGQRIRIGTQDGWAPAVPMVDDYLDALSGRPVTIVTCEGRTVIRPPRTAAARWSAALRLTWGYNRYDTLRTSALDDREGAGRFVAAVASLGLETEGPADGPSAAAFSMATPWVALAMDPAVNTLQHLAAVVALLLALLFGRQAAIRRSLRQARAAIPLVMGGWGTRGKSGTERLKAAVLEGMGVPFVSKTTGCEAMILHAPPGGHALELFLFRPFDKATIWEQANVVVLAARLRARALLWECMALNPIYVDLLQSRWMQDDLSTLTNAYPDHEDIQGPTGMDVAEVLGGFAPPDALLLTTEVNMLPVLEDAARRRGSTVRPLGRVDRELVPVDLMDRMPHVEHPANVALAAAAAAPLGIDPTRAVGLMAEHVVPDLGALSVTPVTRHLSRDVSFANGMSANDTLSFRHNWRRCGFLDHDHAADPGTWLVTVVNNRADRVARSRVFANVLAQDAAAHRHVLIGTNLRGLANYLDEAVANRLHGLSLDRPERVDALFGHLRIVDPAALARSCVQRLGAPPRSADEFAASLASLAATTPDLRAARDAAERARPAAARLEASCAGADGLAEALVDAVARRLAHEAARAAPEPAVRQLYADLVRASTIAIDDTHATGDQIIGRAVTSAPPGTAVRIMGVQNIKGTGLDFAYQWVYLRDLYREIEGLSSTDPTRRDSAISALETRHFGSAIACDAALAALGSSADAETPRGSALRRRITERRSELLAARTAMRKVDPSLSARLLGMVEQVLDPFDAIRRRRRADQVFQDLAAMRISHPKAQRVLQALTARQKGGWLMRGGDAA